MNRTNGPMVEELVEILRLGAGATKTLLAVAHNYTGLQSHWAGRTMLCPGTDDCPGCLAGLETRWLGYLPVVHRKTVYALLEISARAAANFDREREGGSLFNRALTLRKGRRFEPIEITGSKDTMYWQDPPTEDHQVIDQMCRILQLPRLRPGEPIEAWELRLQTVAAARLGVVVRARS